MTVAIFKMASKRVLRFCDYNQLNNFSSVVLYENSNYKKRKTYAKKFVAERIIHRRKVKHDYEYLIKWDGWPLEQSTWEPEEHLTLELLRIYERPIKPLESRLEEAARHFYIGVISALKSASISPVYIPMDLDVWRYVVYNRGVESAHRGYMLYTMQDLSRLKKLPPNWWYVLNDHGEGQAVKPPLKIRPFLSWTPATNMIVEGKMVKGARMPQEKLCVDILRRACDVQNLFT